MWQQIHAFGMTLLLHPKGKAYRAAVISSKGHTVVINSVLRAVRKGAEQREVAAP